MSNTIEAIGLNAGTNLLRDDNKVFKLPNFEEMNRWLEDGDRVELVLLTKTQWSIESYEYPIRFGKYFGNRVFFNTMADSSNINPQFIFDGEKKQWVLFNAGYVCFAETELEFRSNHKVYGGENA